MRRWRPTPAASVRTALVVLFGACSFGAAPILLRTRPADAQSALPPAQATYLADCAVCHGADGRGTNQGPSLVGVGRASIDYEVSTGRMPIDPVTGPDQQPRRHKPRYPAPARTELVDYVAGLTGIEPDIPDVSASNADVAAGGEIFRLNCAACHAWAGDGGALLHREAPALHSATPTQIAEAVRVGPGLMPAFGTAAIDDRKLSDVVAYVRELDNAQDRGGNPLWHLGPVAEGFVAWGAGLSLLILATLWIGDRARG